ncbi:MAG: copper-binding protein [Candidatus Rokubacteria bacterium]|nr:copper-binding protein [Candidatus Rokubacteria bacterium]MBI3824563.1 copper-binding protein [Candidatus Rokubacteria bacterium]
MRGEVVARAASNLLLVRHQAIEGLGMGAMETMAIFADSALLDAAALRPGDRVRLAVRRQGDELTLIRVEKR